METYANKAEFYKDYGDLVRHGWGNLDHTGAPGGWDTALSRLRREDDGPRALETWSVVVAAPFPEIRNLQPMGASEVRDPVPGAVVATSSETGQVLVLFSGQDLKPAFDVIRELETGDHRPNDFSLEEVATAIRTAY